MTVHDDLRWPDGRRIVTVRTSSDIRAHWMWSVESFTLSDPCAGWYETEDEALADARLAIAEELEARRCADFDGHGPGGCRTCGLQAMTDF